MDIIFYHSTFDAKHWLPLLEKRLPQARIRQWREGDNVPADYALVWHPPVAMLKGRELKASLRWGPVWIRYWAS